MSQSTSTKSRKKEMAKGITRIAVSGYKSLYEECSIEVRPLTILAGANSSGKSSIMQPLLLMKQTLESTYDPGALLLNGPHVKFTLASQLFSHISGREPDNRLSILIELENNQSIKNTFVKSPKKPIEIVEMICNQEGEEVLISADMLPGDDIVNNLPKHYLDLYNFLLNEDKSLKNRISWTVERNRCFLEFALSIDEKIGSATFINLINPIGSKIFGRRISQIIHLPGLRGNPERNYKTTAIGSAFPGTFENYVASIINHWQGTKKNHKHLKELCDALEILGLTCKIEAKKIDDTQVEILVSRLPHNSNNKKIDMVSIADVGFGVSQTLPVLVALLIAKRGQLVYLEQPEIHLHPRAQVALAEILAKAANRGVKVVLETHSEKLILSVQSLVAEGKLSPDLVKLHWFTRQEDGMTKVNSANLDEAGAFGDWPEDFGDISLQLESRYLNAAEAHLMKAA